ncbi:MAG: hypothetical protein HY706_12720, partial [Candidatus Hydrogenedentes bacterium]|nr:hypothetical protein [Candidatus Hydrogenedentota bacterium]
IEADVLAKIDQWVRDGGTVIYAYWSRQPFTTVEDDATVFSRWLRGDTGKGRVIVVRDDREPPTRLAQSIADALVALPGLDPLTVRMIQTQKPDEAYVSVFRNGSFAILNYREDAAEVTVPGLPPLHLAPYSIGMVP